MSVSWYIMFAMADHGTYVNYAKGGCRCDECKAAHREYGRKYRETHRDEIRERQRKWVEANQEKLREYYRERYEANRAEQLESARKRYEADPSRVRERSRKRYEADPEKWVANVRKWKAANPDKARAYSLKGQQNRRARRLGAFVEHVDRQVVFERDGWMCHICGEAVDPTLKRPDPMAAELDHIIPLAKGGEESYANCRCSHATCNRKKSAKVA
jgi:5-methylcytosine-specific restriction endonuclease McrA